MKAALLARALELGFDDCRVTTAEPPRSAHHLDAWLNDGRHGSMMWLAKNAAKRANPQHVLPGARSIICVATNYSTPSTPHSDSMPARHSSFLNRHSDGVPARHSSCVIRQSGTVARYARHTDYHEVMGERLRHLALFADALGGPGTRSLWYVDTGPVLERDLAERAGVGFIGKHTNVISRRFGNWLLLGEILTTLELEPDAPEKNRCGRCTRCIAACPTRAITGPFQLDARLCISCLTIEGKGSIPLELRPAIGNRIFGCDDCLEVCPWNRFASEARVMGDHYRADLAEPDLLELLALDEAGFKQRFAGTPVLRAKRRGLLRNVCVALGNVGGPGSLTGLERAASDPEPLIAEHARWAIQRCVAR